MDYDIPGASRAEYRNVQQARQAIAETGAWLADHLPEDPNEVQAKNLAQLLLVEPSLSQGDEGPGEVGR